MINTRYIDDLANEVYIANPYAQAFFKQGLRNYLYGGDKPTFHEITAETAWNKGYNKIKSIKESKMEQLTIQIPEGHEVDNFNKETGVITFKKKESKYPLSISQIPVGLYYINNDWTVGKNSDTYSEFKRSSLLKGNLSTEKRTKAIIALCQLVELRDAWNKIDGFVVIWTNGTTKWCIRTINNCICPEVYSNTNQILYFGYKETRDLFLRTFKDLIEEAKEFL